MSDYKPDWGPLPKFKHEDCPCCAEIPPLKLLLEEAVAYIVFAREHMNYVPSKDNCDEYLQRVLNALGMPDHPALKTPAPTPTPGDEDRGTNND